MALKLEGITRGTGKHAGGVVIAPTKITDFAPLYERVKALPDVPGTTVDEFGALAAAGEVRPVAELARIEALVQAERMADAESAARALTVAQPDLASAWTSIIAASISASACASLLAGAAVPQAAVSSSAPISRMSALSTPAAILSSAACSHVA